MRPCCRHNRPNKDCAIGCATVRISLKRHLSPSVRQSRRSRPTNKKGRRLLALLSDNSRLLQDREIRIEQLQDELNAAHDTIADLRSEAVAAHRWLADNLHSDINRLRVELTAAVQTRSQLQRDLSTTSRQAELRSGSRSLRWLRRCPTSDAFDRSLRAHWRSVIRRPDRLPFSRPPGRAERYPGSVSLRAIPHVAALMQAACWGQPCRRENGPPASA